jgi:hypothetical protein
MKKLLLPIGSAVLATALCTIGCRLAGMPTHDLAVAAAVSGSVSLTAAVGAALFAKRADRSVRI